MIKYPWVFWFKISFRIKWFSYFWKTRGANFIEIQFLIFKISIGRPWLQCYLESDLNHFKTLKYIKNTNDNYIKHWWAFQIGDYNT